MTKHVLVPIATGTEDIELAGLTDCLFRGDIKYTLASVTKDKTVTMACGLKVLADALIEDVSASSFDAVFLPGGTPGAKNLGKNAPLKRIMDDIRAQNKLYGAICHATLDSLAPLGLLEGVSEVTCYPPLANKFPPHVKVSVEKGLVKSGNCLTSRGPDTAILFGLAAVALLQSKEAAHKIAEGLLVAKWPETNLAFNL